MRHLDKNRLFAFALINFLAFSHQWQATSSHKFVEDEEFSLEGVTNVPVGTTNVTAQLQLQESHSRDENTSSALRSFPTESPFTTPVATVDYSNYSGSPHNNSSESNTSSDSGSGRTCPYDTIKIKIGDSYLAMTALWSDILKNLTENFNMALACGDNLDRRPLYHPCFKNSGCYEFGDCCLDKMLSDIRDQRVVDTVPQNASKFGCHAFTLASPSGFKKHGRMIDVCEESFQDMEVIRQCLWVPPSNVSSELLTRHGEVSWPVLSSTTDFVYRNKFCALCNWEKPDTVKRLHIRLSCLGKAPPYNSIGDIADMLDHSPVCDLSYQLGMNISLTRMCAPDKNVYIDKCNVTGLRESYDPILWHGCAIFHSRVSTTLATYKNYFCLLCNYEVMGDFRLGHSWTHEHFYPFVVIMRGDFLTRIREQHEDSCRCADGQIYDHYEDVCRKLRCSEGRILDNNKCVNVKTFISGSAYSTNLQLTPADRLKPLMLTTFENLEQFIYDVILNILVRTHTDNTFIRMLLLARVVSDGTSSAVLQHQIGRLESVKIYFRLIADSDGKMEHHLFHALRSDMYINKWGHFRLEPCYYSLNETTTYNDTITLISSSDGVSMYSLDTGSGIQNGITQNEILVQESLFCPAVSFTLLPNESSATSVISLDPHTGILDHALSGKQISFQYVHVMPDNTVLVCADQLFPTLDARMTPKVPENLFPASLGIVSLVCQGVSVVCLLLVFITYCFFPQLRTLPGKMTLGLVTTLMLAMLSFATGVSKVELGTGCMLLGVVIHYLLLSSFAWMLICSIHMYLTFSNVIMARGNGASGDDGIFTKYFLFATVGPIVVVICTMIGNYLTYRNNSCVPLDLGYGIGICYLSNRWSLILASAVPIGLAVGVNVMLLVATVRSIRSITTNQKIATKNSRQQLFLYVRLSTFTGANWTMGVFAAVLDSVVVWYIFVVLCGLQGIYVFVAFVCNRRIAKLYCSFFCRE